MTHQQAFLPRRHSLHSRPVSSVKASEEGLRLQVWSLVGGRLGVSVWAFVLLCFSFSLFSLFVWRPSPIP